MHTPTFQGEVDFPGGAILQWKWSGHYSSAISAIAEQQLRERQGLVTRFVMKQEELISLFIEGLVCEASSSPDADTGWPPQSKPDPSSKTTVNTDSVTPVLRELQQKARSQEALGRKGSVDQLMVETANYPGERGGQESHSLQPDILSTPQSGISNNQLGMDRSTISMAMRQSATLIFAFQQVGVHNRFHQHFLTLHQWWSELREPPRTTLLARFVASEVFRFVCITVIVINTALMIRTSNYMMENRTDEEPVFDQTLEIAFLVFYVIELTVKLAVHRLYFFCNEEMFWNMFDLIIVVFSCMNTFTISGENNNWSFLRTIRILKLSKIFRIFRVVVFLRDLRVMLSCVINSLASLVWCFVLLALIMVIFAIFYIQSLTRYLVERQGEIAQDVQSTIDDHFDTVQASMLSLYMIATGGLEWGPVYRAFRATGVENCAVLIFFVGFFQVSIFNIVTGLFVEKALKYSRPDLDLEILQHRRDAMKKVQALKALCHQLDLDSNGEIGREEFMTCIMDDPNVRFAFSLEGLDIHDAEAFFNMMQLVQGTDKVDVDTFVAGCLRMRGFATSIDLQTLGMDLKMHVMHSEAMNERVCGHFEWVGNELHRLQRQIHGNQNQPRPEVAACSAKTGADLDSTDASDVLDALGELGNKMQLAREDLIQQIKLQAPVHAA